MTDESTLQKHRNFGRLAEASGSAAVAAVGVMGALIVPMQLSRMAAELPAPHLWGIGIILEMIMIGVIAAMLHQMHDCMKR